MTEDTEHRIIVGMEGSGGAKAALRWALGEAKHRDAVVEVLTAYSNTYAPASPDFNYVPLEPADLEKEVRKMQNAVIEEVLQELDGTDSSTNVERTVRRGRAADTLIAAGEKADMLVVGSRGRGGFRGLLLGSVSQQIVHHAACPVVIVRPDLL